MAFEILGISDFYEFLFGPIKLSCIYVGEKNIAICAQIILLCVIYRSLITCNLF